MTNILYRKAIYFYDNLTTNKIFLLLGSLVIIVFLEYLFLISGYNRDNLKNENFSNIITKEDKENFSKKLHFLSVKSFDREIEKNFKFEYK